MCKTIFVFMLFLGSSRVGEGAGPARAGKDPKCSGGIPFKNAEDCYEAAGAGDKSGCDSALTTALAALGCEAPDTATKDRLKEKAANAAVSKCKMASGVNCDAKFQEITGKAPDANKLRQAAEKGAVDALGGKLKDCRGNATCIAAAEASMRAAKGAGYTDQDFAFDKRKAGWSAVGAYIEECVANATNSTEKTACYSSNAGRCALAESAGKNCSDISAEDVKKGAREYAKTEVLGSVSTCISSAANDAAKKACRQGSDLKGKIAAATGKDVSNVKDSDVMGTIKRGGQSDMLDSVKSCTSDAATCRQQAKDAYQAATGKTISDGEMKRELNKAKATTFADSMITCLEEAGSDRQSCETYIRGEMQKADPDGKAPDQTKLELQYKRGGEVKASEGMKDCTGDRATCMAQTKTQVQNAMGGKTLKNVDLEKLNREGASKDAADSVDACVTAKQDDPAATCDDFLTSFYTARGQSQPTDAKEKRRSDNKARQSIAKSVEKSAREACLPDSTDSADSATQKAAYDACVAALDSTDTIKEVYPGLSDAQITKRRKTLQREADRELSGEEFTTCMTNAGANNETAKAACKAALQSRKDVMGLSGSVEDLIKLNRGAEIAAAAQACVGTAEKKQCRADAKQAAIDAGMKAREWVQAKKRGEIEASAQAYSACKLEGNATEAECLEDAKDSYQEVSGSTTDAAWDAVKDKVVRVGTAKAEGKVLKLFLRCALDVDVVFSTSACDTALQAAVISKLGTEMGSNSNYVNLSTPITRGAGCRISDDKAEYQVEVRCKNGTNGTNGTDLDTAADSFASTVTSVQYTTSRRLSSDESSSLLERLGALTPRQLATVSAESGYAAQGEEMCAEDDTSCEETTSAPGPTPDGTTNGTTPTPAPTPVPAPTPKPDGVVANLAQQRVLDIAVVITMLFVASTS